MDQYIHSGFTQLYVKVDYLLTLGKHLYYPIILQPGGT